MTSGGGGKLSEREKERERERHLTIASSFSSSTHMQGLKDVTNNVHYENFRCQKLAGVSGVVTQDPKKFQAPSR